MDYRELAMLLGGIDSLGVGVKLYHVLNSIGEGKDHG